MPSWCIPPRLRRDTPAGQARIGLETEIDCLRTRLFASKIRNRMFGKKRAVAKTSPKYSPN